MNWGWASGRGSFLDSAHNMHADVQSMEWVAPEKSSTSKKSNQKLNNLCMFMGKMSDRKTEIIRCSKSSCCIKMWDIFPFSLFRVRAVSFCFWVFFLLSLFPSLFASTEKRADQYETLKLSLCAWKLEICVPAEHSLHTYTLPVCCSASTYLCAQEICVILHPSLKGEKKKARKRKKVSFILRQEPSQCSMPNWHHTLALSTLSCRSCTATGLFNKLKVCLGFKKKKKM